jgi:DNA-binding winged helix-turn-helix (wHTH) protein
MMTPLDNARLDLELHANALRRALGAGGAAADLERAIIEVEFLSAAVTEIRRLLQEEM